MDSNGKHLPKLVQFLVSTIAFHRILLRIILLLKAGSYVNDIEVLPYPGHGTPAGLYKVHLLPHLTFLFPLLQLLQVGYLAQNARYPTPSLWPDLQNVTNHTNQVRV